MVYGRKLQSIHFPNFPVFFPSNQPKKKKIIKTDFPEKSKQV